MREIKFRAWHDKDKAMYEFQTTGDHAGQFLWREVPRDEDMTRRPTIRHYKDWSCLEFDSQFHVMQFTGLLDKNGKEIYEGDIYEYQHVLGKEYWSVDKIEWQENMAGWGIDKRDSKLSVVIGNVYQNPELLA